MKSGNVFDGFMIVSDMDGTLLNSKFEISDENIKALKGFVDEGGIFTIATGRMELGVERYIRSLPVNAPVILYNGALIYDFYNTKILWNSCLENNLKSILNNLKSKFPHIGIEIFQGGDVYFMSENEETEKHRKKEGFLPKYVLVDQIPEPWYKVILTTQPSKLTEIENYINRTDKPFRMVYSEPQFLELLSKSASKGTALIELAKITGIGMENVISIGDNCNDIEMIEASGIGFAVENAHQNLKRIARYSCVHHDQHAAEYVVKWLRRVLLIEKQQ